MEALQEMGSLTYVLLFGLAFLETMFFLTPFLPGPSLLFAAGTVAARPGGPLDVAVLFLIFAAGGILGDSLNYALGRGFGPRVARFLRRDAAKEPHPGLAKAEEFFETHGGKTIVMARFVPGVRTLVPLVAGWKRMDFARFIGFNALGGALCVATFLYAGYFFGGVPAVRANFPLVILGIALVSLAPAIVEWVRFGRNA